MDHSPFRSWKCPCFGMNTQNRTLCSRTVAFAVPDARTETVGAVVCRASQAHLTGTMVKISIRRCFSRSDRHSSSTGPAHVASHARRESHQHCHSRQYRRRRNHIRLGNYGGLPPRCLAIHCSGRRGDSDRYSVAGACPDPASYQSAGIAVVICHASLRQLSGGSVRKASAPRPSSWRWHDGFRLSFG